MRKARHGGLTLLKVTQLACSGGGTFYPSNLAPGPVFLYVLSNSTKCTLQQHVCLPLPHLVGAANPSVSCKAWCLAHWRCLINMSSLPPAPLLFHFFPSSANRLTDGSKDGETREQRKGEKAETGSSELAQRHRVSPKSHVTSPGLGSACTCLPET